MASAFRRPRCLMSDATGQNCRVVPESANCKRKRRRVEVLVVELQPPEAALERKRRLARARLGTRKILQPSSATIDLDDDDRRHVLAEAGVPAPAVLQIVFARPVEDEGVRLGHVLHRPAVRREHQRAGSDRPAVRDSCAVARASSAAALRPAAAAAAPRGSTCTARRGSRCTFEPLSTLSASCLRLGEAAIAVRRPPCVRYSPSCSRISESMTRHVASSWPATAPTIVPMTFSAMRRSLTSRGSRSGGRATVGADRPS